MLEHRLTGRCGHRNPRGSHYPDRHLQNRRPRRPRHSPSHRQPGHYYPCPCTCFDSEGRSVHWAVRARQVAQVARDGHLQTNIHPHQPSHPHTTHSGSENGKSRYLSLEACNLPVHRASSFHVGHGKGLAEYLETDRRAATVRLERPYFGTCVVAVVAGAAAAAFAAAFVVVVAAVAAAVASAASRSDPY